MGPHCPIDLLQRCNFDRYVVQLSRSFDDEGYEQGERINGFVECPKCGLWWPCIEEPDCWEEDDEQKGKWVAIGWWGGVVCDECRLLIVDQPDGHTEVYQL